MQLLRAATLTTQDLSKTTSLYAEYFDYVVVEESQIADALAASWNAPASAGQPYVTMQPASGADVFLRFVEQPAHPDYLPLRSYGWAAVEICVQDVMRVSERMANSPFEIIGPPKELDGLPAIFPMQVKGPDGEIVYLTQIRDNLPDYDLPRAASLIDKLFILVMGCSDLRASMDWMAENIGLDKGRDMEINVTMLAAAYDAPMDTRYRIATMTHGRDVFLELDQFPDAATPRARHEGMLPPGCAIGTFRTPDLDALPANWISPPARRPGPIYDGARVATKSAPDGTLVEVVEQSPS